MTILTAALLCSVSACGDNAELEELRKENEELKQQLHQTDTTSILSDESDYIAKWIDSEPYTIESNTGKLIISKDVHIVKDTDDYLLLLNFTYTNLSDKAKNFINDDDFSVKPFQNGIMLDSPYVTSKDGIFDANNSYKNIKQGASLDTQLAFILNDTASPVEIEIGDWNDYDKKIIKKLEINIQ